MIHVQETLAHKRRRMSPKICKGNRLWVCHQCENLDDKTCPYWDEPYEMVAKKAHDLYVIQVDKRLFHGNRQFAPVSCVYDTPRRL